MKIKLGFSTCPNDTFMFDAMVNNKIDTGDIEFEIYMGDIFHLNEKAMAGELDMVKISYNTYGNIQDDYHLLGAGSALGYKCGPLLISKNVSNVEEILDSNLPVAIPGVNTTANLLLSFFEPRIQNRKEMIFDEIMPAVVSGEAIAGVIIHENRFTYQEHGLNCVQDLGDYWEKKNGLPIPLGAIVAKNKLGEKVTSKLEILMRQSVEYAFAHPDESMEFVRKYAQEMDEKVMKSHIGLYVNKFSIDLGDEGMRAVQKLLEVKNSQ